MFCCMPVGLHHTSLGCSPCGWSTAHCPGTSYPWCSHPYTQPWRHWHYYMSQVTYYISSSLPDMHLVDCAGAISACHSVTCCLLPVMHERFILPQQQECHLTAYDWYAAAAAAVTGTKPDDLRLVSGLTSLTSLRLIPSGHGLTGMSGLSGLLPLKHLKRLNVRCVLRYCIRFPLDSDITCNVHSCMCFE